MSRTTASAPPLALTMGDPAGIGLDITLKSWTDRDALQLPPFTLFGCARALAARAERLGLSVPVRLIDSASEAAAVFSDALPVVALPLKTLPIAGAPSRNDAATVIAAIEKAVAAVAAGEASAVVTNPVAKSVLYATGFEFPGHTEFLADLAEQHWPKSGRHRSVMMLAAPELRVVPVTVHIPLRMVPSQLSTELILETLRIVHAALQRDFGIAAPRLAVTGLNPHAGESGTLGDEDDAIIRPAIAAAKAEGFDVSGPHPADTLFHAAKRTTYDAVIAMYHDQALIPLKTIAFDEGVNVTLGLPFVRTSPDHGTAFDIAGSGQANPASLIAALRLGDAMAAARRQSSA